MVVRDSHGDSLPTTLTHTLRQYLDTTGITVAEVCSVTAITFLAVALEGFAITLLLPLLRAIEQGTDQLVSEGLPRLLQLFLSWVSSMGLGSSLRTVLTLLVGLNVLRIGMTYLRMFYRAELKKRAELTLRTKLFDGLLRARLSFVEGSGRGPLVSSLTAEAEHVGNLVFSVTNMLGQGMMLIIFSLMSFMISPSVTLLALVAFGGFYAVNRAQISQSRALGGDIVDRNQKFTGMLLDRIADLRSVKINGTESTEARRLVGLADRVGDVAKDLNRRNATAQVKIELFALVMLTAILIVAIFAAGVSISSVAVIAFLLVRLVPVSNQFLGAVQNVRVFSGSFRNIVDTLAMVEAAREDEGADVVFRGLEKGIGLEDVWFSYEGGGGPIFKRLSGDILAGRLNAVAGPSGSGKTTLLDLLIGLRVPTRGRVLFDGIPLSQFRAASLRHRTAYVSQQAALFRGTVRENVLYGCPSGEPDRLHRALVAAQAAEFVDRLPQQVDTPVGDGHQGLSVGQTQRLLLARALVREPAIILLDEPTSALDEETGSKLIDTLSQIASEGRTVVVATHDPAVIAATDHIVRLENCKTI